MSPALSGTANALERMTIVEEVLPSGRRVFVATDMDLDGCIAQGDSRDEAVSALLDARLDYGEVVKTQRLAPRQAFQVAGNAVTNEGVYYFGNGLVAR